MATTNEGSVSTQPPAPLHLHVRVGGHTRSVSVAPETTLSGLRAQLGVPAMTSCREKLICKGRVLTENDKNRSLESLGVVDGDKLFHVASEATARWSTVNVHFIGGQKLSLRMDTASPIQSVKRRVQEVTGDKWENLILVWENTHLEDAATLQDLGLPPNAVLYCISKHELDRVSSCIQKEIQNDLVKRLSKGVPPGAVLQLPGAAPITVPPADAASSAASTAAAEPPAAAPVPATAAAPAAPAPPALRAGLVGMPPAPMKLDSALVDSLASSAVQAVVKMFPDEASMSMATAMASTKNPPAAPSAPATAKSSFKGLRKGFLLGGGGKRKPKAPAAATQPKSQKTVEHASAAAEATAAAAKAAEVVKAASSPPRKTKTANHCNHDECTKRLGLMPIKCRCGHTFCAKHRYPEAHSCTFDFRHLEQERLRKLNPLVEGARVTRI